MNNGRSLTLHNNQKQSKTRELTKVITLSFTNTRGDYEGDVASTMRDDRMQVGARALCLRGKCSGVQRERRVACQCIYLTLAREFEFTNCAMHSITDHGEALCITI